MPRGTLRNLTCNGFIIIEEGESPDSYSLDYYRTDPGRFRVHVTRVFDSCVEDEVPVTFIIRNGRLQWGTVALDRNKLPLGMAVEGLE